MGFAVLVLLAAAALSYLPRLNGHTLSVCALVDLDAVGGPTPASSTLVAALGRAASDISLRDCRGAAYCQAMMSEIGDSDIHVNLTLWGVAKDDEAAIVRAAIACQGSGAHALLTAASSQGLSAALLASAIYNLPVISSSAAPPALPGQEGAIYGRLQYSGNLKMAAMTEMILYMQWDKAAVVYSTDPWGVSMRTVLEVSLRDAEPPVQVAYISAGSGSDPGSFLQAAKALQKEPGTVVILLLKDSSKSLEAFAQAAEESSLDPSQHIFLNIDAESPALSAQVPSEPSIMSRMITFGFNQPDVGVISAEDDSMDLVTIGQVDDGPSGAAEMLRGLVAAPGFEAAQARAYDALWAMAMVWSKAPGDADASEPAAPKMGVAEFSSLLATTAFTGASGTCSWDESGRRKSGSISMTVTAAGNLLAGEANTSQPIVVGSWDTSKGFELTPGVNWADGSVGFKKGEGVKLLYVAIIVPLALVCLALIMLFLVRLKATQQRSPRRDSGGHESTILNDLEPPMVRALDFLDRYQKNWFAGRPTRSEASQLRKYITNHSTHAGITASLRSALSHSPSYTSEVVEYLMANHTSESDKALEQNGSFQSRFRIKGSSSSKIIKAGDPDELGLSNSTRGRLASGLDLSSPARESDREVPPSEYVKLLASRMSLNNATELTDFLHSDSEQIATLPGSVSEVQPLQPAVQPFLRRSSEEGDLECETLVDPLASPSRKRARRKSVLINDRAFLGSTFTIEQIMENITLSEANMTRADVATIGDFSLDFVSPSATLAANDFPLTITAKYAVTALNLGRLLRLHKAATRFVCFSNAVELGYPMTGYHCRRHGADVTNRLVGIVLGCGIADEDPWTKLACLVSAIVHDYRHPQVNNAFLVAKEHLISQAFNDQAVVENYSLRCSLDLIKNPDLDFLNAACSNTTNRRKSDPLTSARLRAKLRGDFRKMVVSMVLGTDMTKHFDILGQFNALVRMDNKLATLDSGSDKWNAMSHAQQTVTLQIAIKVADIGHCAVGWDQHRQWLQRLEDEMFTQGDAELESGMDVSPLMDRNKAGVTIPASQTGFYEVIVLPLLTAWVDVFKESQPLLDQAHENVERYKAMCHSSH